MVQPALSSDRRHFLWQASAAGAFFAAHGFAEEPPPTATKTNANRGPRILSLELHSTAPLAAMKDFYHGSLGLPVHHEGTERLTIVAGETNLTFLPAGPKDQEPFYHFAFNIPENKVAAAWKWQRERSPLLPIPARLRDSRYPDDVVNYAHWNAHSVFFFDPAGNVVEYIARHDLNNAAPGQFTSDDILYASEIAFVADDVPQLAGQLKDLVGVPPYRGGSEEFTALGDEHGLLLVMKRGRVISFDAPQKKAVSVFPTVAKVRGLRSGTHRLVDRPFELIIE